MIAGRNGMALFGASLLILVSFGGPAEAEERGGMAFIPAGEFTMGSDNTDGRIGVDVGVDSIPR
ncbi:MAG TPA: hypothetical protein VLB09_01840, partial [Nitrospiria bacterium]|nr:hypothetical protein [Nitrospiria bacterium]